MDRLSKTIVCCDLTDAETAILGLLHDKPKYAYQIKGDIDAFGMLSWTALTPTTVPKLLRQLELRKLIEVHPRKVAGKRQRNYYHLTQSGRGSFLQAIRTRLTQHEVQKGSFDVAVYWSDAIPSAEAIQLLNRYRDSLVESQNCWEKMVPYLAACGCPKADQALCERKSYMLLGELQWMEKYLKALRQDAARK
jgi:DNA-binding PadR family transcriptional regulator